MDEGRYPNVSWKNDTGKDLYADKDNKLVAGDDPTVDHLVARDGMEIDDDYAAKHGLKASEAPKLTKSKAAEMVDASNKERDEWKEKAETAEAEVLRLRGELPDDHPDFLKPTGSEGLTKTED